MTLKTKPYSWPGLPVLLLAAAMITLPAGGSAAHSGSQDDVSRPARSRTAPTAIRTEPARQSRERAVTERPVTSYVAGKRDPFEAPPPPNADGGRDGPYGPLPAGIRGLVIGQLRLEGIVRDEESGMMIAVVTNQSNLAYFLHLHQEVYNGVVSRITPEAIFFQQKSLDPGDRLEARQVILRLGSERQEER
ncbi:MAG TPA: hypothetical protein VFQ24_11400 [Terriglobia bacterium]|nr:hypothetical protein [Terriglobia bacterium]